MVLCNLSGFCNYEGEKLCRLFFPFEKITVTDSLKEDFMTAVTYIENGVGYASLKIGDKTAEFKGEIKTADKYETELKLCKLLYKCLVKLTGYEPPFGMLTGIRPAKLFLRYSDIYGTDKAREIFKNDYFVSPAKISLCEMTGLAEKSIIDLSKDNSFSLYISVPFCPSRCAYCSFVSHSVEKAAVLIPDYVKLLIKEIKQTAEISKTLKLRLETVYIGGGTPTTLNALQLKTIMNTVNKEFDTSALREFTVEAGRPDTLDEEKLKVIKENGATRISINPQTMNDEVLKKIGRRHTSEQMIKAFNTARKIGFDNINTDLIAGLNGDTLISFKNTLDKIIDMSPESITVHSLAVKHASSLNKSGEIPCRQDGNTAKEMVDYSLKRLTQNGFLPYYMYRQSKTVGNLENVGYAKKGYEGLYNVFIMDETHSILACGASAVTKLKDSKTGNIRRIYNYKYPYEYISRFEEIKERKKEITEFYKKRNN